MKNALAYDTYAQNNIQVESPQKLVEMMLEGVLRFNANAVRAIELNDVEKRIYWINRSCAVIAELINTLDKKSQPSLGAYLEGLYTHQVVQLALANANDDGQIVENVSVVFKGLLEAWHESAQ